MIPTGVKFTSVPVSEVSNREKKVPENFISPGGK